MQCDLISAYPPISYHQVLGVQFTVVISTLVLPIGNAPDDMKATVLNSRKDR
ncbi:hypothetical protein CY34DRAFT_800869 [Suillus luteus UH-Slu-Lm8-n1]|uniref:Uncharacterized protein n=1 Tax=Suillus luteus UH-Slu-Lm8-n1 TaxID=930992 RepID=A0A0D0AWH4_9AGAM|nr:hypothetical protein CY34DRAFT_800869 [Suillus luteus UH-Slu-Lm8-n1]